MALELFALGARGSVVLGSAGNPPRHPLTLSTTELWYERFWTGTTACTHRFSGLHQALEGPKYWSTRRNQ
jgi:hypothetical protein